MDTFKSKKLLDTGGYGRVYLVCDDAGTESVVKEKGWKY